MTRPTLRAIPKRKATSLSEVKRALRIWKSEWTTKAVRHHNVRMWLRANAILGDNHVYKGGPAKWGHNVRAEMAQRGKK